MCVDTLHEGDNNDDDNNNNNSPIVMKLEFLLQIFEKVLKYQI
jgi:hypothetical protein